MQLDRSRQDAVRRIETGLHDRHHRARDLVDEGIDLILAPARDGHLVCQDYIGNRQVVLFGVLPQLLHRGERVLRRILLGRLIPFPLDESAAHGVILLLEEHLVSGHQLDRHRVRMREVAVHRIEDDVLERDIHGLGPELHRERLIRLVAQAIEKGGIDGRGLLSDQPRERRRAPCRAPYLSH